MPDKKILLVDDDPRITAICTHLATLGFMILNAYNGNKALEMIKSEHPGLVILDMEMPDIDGLQLLSILKSEYKDIKAFVFTAHGIEYKKKAEKIGYDHYFDKDDYELNELEDAIKEAFGMEKIIERKEVLLPSGTVPKARLLFIEPSIQMYSFTSALFDNPNFCKGEYEKKVLYCDIDTLTGVILAELMDFQPNIVLINDYAMSEDDILNMVGLIRNIKIQPDEVVVHGLFERGAMFEAQLKKTGAKRCIQNVMNHEQMIEMNEKLINFVGNVCVGRGLVKK